MKCGSVHGLRTPNEGKNQRNLSKLGRMWQTKYASAVLKKFGVGVDFLPCSEGDFNMRYPVKNILLDSHITFTIYSGSP